jgi:hypothetical protein
MQDPDMSQENDVSDRAADTKLLPAQAGRGKNNKKERYKLLTQTFQRLLSDTDLRAARRRVLNSIWRDVHNGVNTADSWYPYLTFLGKTLHPDLGLGAREHPCVFLELKKFDIGLEAHSKNNISNANHSVYFAFIKKRMPLSPTIFSSTQKSS